MSSNNQMPTFNFYRVFNKSELDTNCYTADRGGQEILGVVCHDTAGPNDFNTPWQTEATGQFLSDQAANYLASNIRQVSVHYLVGAESAGAPIYKIVPEEFTAYHAGGSAGYPSLWRDPGTGHAYGGYGLNQVTIGIERFGQPSDTVGPLQQAALRKLVLDIISRNPILGRNKDRFVAHASLEGDRTDGRCWVNAAQGWITTPLPSPQQQPGKVITVVAPGKVVGIGIQNAARIFGDTVETDEEYCTFDDDGSDCSFAWGLERIYMWTKVVPGGVSPIASYRKQFEISPKLETVEDAAKSKGESLIGNVRTATRKSDKVKFRVGWSASYFYFEDGGYTPHISTCYAK